MPAYELELESIAAVVHLPASTARLRAMLHTLLACGLWRCLRGEDTHDLPRGLLLGQAVLHISAHPNGARAGTQAIDLSLQGSLEVHAAIVPSAGHTESSTMLVVGYHAAAVTINSAREVCKERM